MEIVYEPSTISSGRLRDCSKRMRRRGNTTVGDDRAIETWRLCLLSVDEERGGNVGVEADRPCEVDVRTDAEVRRIRPPAHLLVSQQRSIFILFMSPFFLYSLLRGDFRQGPATEHPGELQDPSQISEESCV